MFMHGNVLFWNTPLQKCCHSEVLSVQNFPIIHMAFTSCMPLGMLQQLLSSFLCHGQVLTGGSVNVHLSFIWFHGSWARSSDSGKTIQDVPYKCHRLKVVTTIPTHVPYKVHTVCSCLPGCLLASACLLCATMVRLVQLHAPIDRQYASEALLVADWSRAEILPPGPVISLSTVRLFHILF